MKRLFLSLFLLFTVAAPWTAMAQGGYASVIIGTGTSSDYYAPFNNYYKNSTSEVIYTSTEIGNAGFIDTIWFYSDNTNTFTCSTLKVYMGTTSAASFTSTTSWITESDLDLVFDATNISIGGVNGWYAIPLQTSYLYASSDNLVVAVTKTAPSWSSSCKWRYTSNSNMAIYRQNDSDTSYGSISSLTSSTTGTQSDKRPNIKLSMNTNLGGCVRPLQLAVSNLTDNSATLSWMGCNDALSYQVCFGTTNNMSSYVATAQSAYDTNFFFDNLDDSTTYYVWVRTLCATDTTVWAAFSFTTMVSCARVADASVDSVAESMAVVTWRNDGTSGQTLDHVLIQYKAADATTWLMDSVYSDTSYTITGLQGGTDYMVRLIAICSEDTSNAVSLTFTTPTCGEYFEATTTNNYVPFNGTYNYGYSQAIYPAGGLSGVTTISGIYFYTNSAPSSYSTRTVTIALGNTTQSTLSTSNYVPYASMTEVATNVSMDVSTPGWIYIPFTTPFSYDGTSNVVVAVQNLTGSWSGFLFYHHTPILGNAVYWYQDSGPISTASPSATSSGTTTTVPDIRFDADCGGGGSSSDCQRPTDLSVDMVDFNSVDLSWTGCPSADGYQVRYNTTSTLNDSAAVTMDAANDFYTLTGLRNNTTYYIWVRSVCGEDASPWSQSVMATTLEACASLENVRIEDTSNTYITLSWEVNTSVGHPLTQVVVSWRAVGEANWNHDVVIGSTSYILVGLRSGVSYELTLTSVCGADSSNAIQLTFTTPACYEYIGGTASNSSVPFNTIYDYGYSQIIYPGTVLSDVDTIRGISFRANSAPSSCTTRVVSVAMGNTTRTSLTTSNYIAYSNMTEVASQFSMDVSAPGWIYIPFSTPFVYDGTSNVVVAVTNHTGDYSSFSFSHHSTTLGNAIYWYRDNTPITPTSPAGTTGTSNTVPDIRFDAPCGYVGCTPPVMVVTRIGVTDIQIRWVPIGDEEEWVVGYKTGNDAYTYTTVTTTTYMFTGLTEETLYSLCVGTVCDGDTVFVYKSATTNSSGTGIDCITPYGLATTALTHSSMSLVWYALGFEQQWQIRIYNDDMDSLITVSATTLQFDSLQELTTYHVQVRANCEGGNSAWSTPIDVTTPETTYECVAPNRPQVIAATDSSFVLTWEPQGRENKWQIRVYNYSFDSSYRAYSPNVVVGGMSPQTAYNVKVRAVCGAGDTSDWSSPTSYTTRSYAGVEDLADNADVRIYPNPTTHDATVAVSGVNGRVAISVLDLRGRVVRTDQMECDASCVKTLQVEGLAQGAYFVRISSDNFSTVRKLFIE